MNSINAKKIWIVLFTALILIVAGLYFSQTAIAADSREAVTTKTLSNGIVVSVKSVNPQDKVKLIIEETSTRADNTVGTPCANFKVYATDGKDYECTITLTAPNAAYAYDKAGHVYVQHEPSQIASQDFAVVFDGSGSTTINSKLGYFSIVADIVAPGGTNNTAISPQTGVY